MRRHVNVVERAMPTPIPAAMTPSLQIPFGKDHESILDVEIVAFDQRLRIRL